MIIANGSIQFKSKTATGIVAETGFPASPSKVVWGSSIPCQWYETRHDRMALDSGEPYTQREYEVLIEYPDYVPQPGEQLKLLDRAGTEIGQFAVTWDEALDAVSQHRLHIK